MQVKLWVGEKYNGSLCTTDETVGSHLTRCVSCRPPCRHRPGQSVEATTSYDHKNTPTHKGIVQIRPPSEHMLQIHTHTPLKAARKNTKASIWTYKGGNVINHIYLLYKFTTKWSSAKPLKWIFEKLYTFSWDWNSIPFTLVK